MRSKDLHGECHQMHPTNIVVHWSIPMQRLWDHLCTQSRSSGSFLSGQSGKQGKLAPRDQNIIRSNWIHPHRHQNIEFNRKNWSSQFSLISACWFGRRRPEEELYMCKLLDWNSRQETKLPLCMIWNISEWMDQRRKNHLKSLIQCLHPMPIWHIETSHQMIVSCWPD